MSIPQPTAATPSDDALITQRDMLGALEILESAAPEPDELIVLTDEELLGLAGPSALTLLGDPYLAQDGVDTPSAAASGVRGLVARGLVRVDPEGRENEGEVVSGEGDPAHRSVQLQRQLAGVIALRRIPEAMITVSRMLAGGTTRLGAYLFPGGGVLEEYVTIDGFHHFSVPTREAIPDRLATFIDTFDSATEDGDVEIVASPEAIEHEVADTRSLSVLTALVEGEGRQVTFFGGEDRMRVLDHGELGPAGTTGPYEVCDVSPSSLLSLLADLVPVVDEDPDPEASTA